MTDSDEVAMQFAAIPWSSPLLEIWPEAQNLFDACTTNSIRQLAIRAASDPLRRNRCESLPFMHKVNLLYDPETQTELRLHFYLEDYKDTAHNHRWDFGCRVLAGSYLHRLYGDDGHIDAATTMDELSMTSVRQETQGSTYLMSHTSIHSVRARAGTVSLILRGPPRKSEFLVLSERNESTKVFRGSVDESESERQTKRMSLERLDSLLSLVSSSNLSATSARRNP